MSIVSLVSGGLDSTLMTYLAMEEGVEILPLFINYGQLAANREYEVCISNFKRYNLPDPEKVNIEDLGRIIPCGLTQKKLDIFHDAFFPGRNLLFLLIGASYAYRKNASSVSIGLLNEESSLFPDQTVLFVRKTEELLSMALGRQLKIKAPLSRFSKSDVILLAHQKNITGTYSCHSGDEKPCGVCIACREFNQKEA